jgi:hypothetical protein
MEILKKSYLPFLGAFFSSFLAFFFISRLLFGFRVRGLAAPATCSFSTI